jgi:type IV secretory pathway VirD2 relaxase
MSPSPNIASAFRFSKLLRDAMQGETFQPGSRLHIARPLDAESLTGRHEGRSRHIAGGKKPSLSGELQKRLGSSRKLARGKGKAGNFNFDPRQRVIVKVHFFSHGGGGAAALSAHARYVARDAAARPQDLPAGDDKSRETDASRTRSPERAERSVFYDATEDGVDGGARAAQWSRDDRRHFRLILSAENGSRIGDLRSYTREVMQRAELALGSRLEWIAVDHWDTDNPHTHVILRGRRDHGRDLVIPREYVSHGLRSAAQDVATERLGERGRDEARLSLRREALAHRPSWLDRIIEAQLDERGQIRVARLEAPNRSPEVSDALKARAHELKRLGLATEVRRNIFQFEPGWRDGLKAMELHLDIRKALMQARTRDPSRGVDPVSKALRLDR